MAQDCYKLISECTHFQHEAALVHDDQTRDALSKDVAQLHKLVNTRVDRVSAHVLHFADEFANDKGEIQVGLQQVRQGERGTRGAIGGALKDSLGLSQVAGWMEGRGHHGRGTWRV